MVHYSNTSNPVDFPKLTTIDRLWGEALDRAVPGTYTNLTASQIEKVKAVFAELIVRECTSKCEFVANMATITNTGEMARKTKATADSCATMIKEHFGVEE